MLDPILAPHVEADPLRCSSPPDPTNLPPKQASATQPTEVVNWAQIYLDRGYGIVPVPTDKRPTAGNWSTRTAALTEFRVDDNIGILTGPLSGNLVCVDIDSALAIQLADEFLPKTAMIEGRPGKTDSHRYYRALNVTADLTAPATSASGKALGGPLTRRYFAKNPDGGRGECVVEIRGTGQQAVAPPSLHVGSGERRVWTEFGAPAAIEAKELYAAVDALAVQCGCASRLQPPTAGSYRQRSERSCRGVADRREFDDLPPMATRVERARAYLAKIADAVSGEGGHDQTFQAACLLVRDFALDRESAWELLLEYNERCDPEWTAEELEHKLDDADHFDGERGGKLVAALPEKLDDPHRLARAFLDRGGVSDGRSSYAYYREEFWSWDGRRYVAAPQHEFEAELNGFIRRTLEQAVRLENRRLDAEHQAAWATWQDDRTRPVPRPPTQRCLPDVTPALVKSTAQALQGLTLLKENAVQQPCWLLTDRQGESRSLLSLQNGLLDVGAHLGGRTILLPHTPRWFSPVCLPYDWDPAAICPKWLAALDLTFGGDAERIAVLQEWFGYCLLPDTRYHKFLMLHGEGNNGKSVICAALTALLGEQNVSNVTLEEFGDTFALHGTLGKLANIASEIGELDKSDEGKLKAFSAGDRMAFARKFRTAVETTPTARLVFATNSVPRFSDKTQGLWRRLLLIPCDVTIPKERCVVGMHEAAWWVRSGDLPGMLLWAIAGLRRLRANGAFSDCQVSMAALTLARNESNPARLFLLETCEAVAEAAGIECGELYRDYQHWCEANGYRCPLTAGPFAKEVARAFPAVERRRLGGRQGRAWTYVGLRLRVD